MTFSAAMHQNLNLGAVNPYRYAITANGVELVSMVPLESAHVTEAAPGGISSMEFEVWDTAGIVTIADDAEIRMHDILRNRPTFAGFLQSQRPQPAFGGTGRTLSIRAYGIESWLDRVIVPSVTFGPNSVGGDGADLYAEDALQVFAAHAPIRSFARKLAPNVNVTSSQENPVGFGTGSDGTMTNVVTFEGMTIRQAWEARKAAPVVFNPSTLVPAVTVDFYGGLRVFPWSGSWAPSDYDTLTIGAGVYASDITYERDTSPGALTTAVFIKGGTAAGTGWVVGNTSAGRHERFIEDSTVTSRDGMLSVAKAVLGQRQTAAGRGEFTLENYTPTLNIHPGSPLVITDPNLGWSARTFLVSEISKTFRGGPGAKEDWRISFFDDGDSPSTGPASLVKSMGQR